MSKKLLTTEDVKEIAISELSYEKLCAKYKIGKNTVAKIKKAAGTCSGSRNQNTKKLSDKQKQYVIDCKKDGATLSKELGVSTAWISAIRMKAGVAAGRGINITLSLSEDQKKEIAFSTLSQKELAKKYKTSSFTIAKIKKEFGTNVGRGNGKRKTGFKLTDEQKSEIVESNLPYDELGLKYGVHESTIGKIKRKAGVFVKRLNHNNEKVNFTPEMIERLKDVTTSSRKLAPELGVSVDRILRKRKELGINYDEWKRNNPKPRAARIYTPKPKKPTVNLNGRIELPIRKLETKKKPESTPMRETKFEYENKLLENARKAKESHEEIIERQKKEGYRYINRISERGVKSRVWTNKSV